MNPVQKLQFAPVLIHERTMTMTVHRIQLAMTYGVVKVAVVEVEVAAGTDVSVWYDFCVAGRTTPRDRKSVV